jgi:L-lactate dehydrogenase complex protein LldG
LSREAILGRVRSALNRRAGLPAAEVPETYLRIPEVDMEARIQQFTAALENLGGRVIRVAGTAEVCGVVKELIAGESAVASEASFLRSCGIPRLPGVRWNFTSEDDYREARAQSAFGITSADYALADTGSLVMLSGNEESRLVSLLPPAHIAVVPVSRLLTGLDELLMRVPTPAELTSAMVIITGPSRTADIEQILVRGVHGPGRITVILADRAGR